MITAQAIVFAEPGKVEVRALKLPEIAPDQLLVETIYTQVSPGTELRVFGGHYGAGDKFPLVPGYISVGKIVEVGAQTSGWRVGDWVSGRNPVTRWDGVSLHWGGQASHHLFTTKGEDRPVLLPTPCDPLDYALTEIAAIPGRGIAVARAQHGETAVVIGQGMIGALSAAWLVARGCRVAVVDLEASRLERARRVGVALATEVEGAAARLETFCNGGADIVVEASGSIPGVELAYQLVRGARGAAQSWPRLVMQANYLDEVSHDPFGFTLGEGVTILSPRDRNVEDRQRAVEAIRRREIDPALFRDAILPFSRAAEGYAALQNRERFSVIFDWSEVHQG